MSTNVSRRSFIASSAGLLAASAASRASAALLAAQTKPLFQISLAQWSLHRAIRGGKLDNLDFAATTKNEFGIDGVEYVNQFFKDKAQDTSYLAEMNKRASDAGVKQLLIMVDGEGRLGDPSLSGRAKAVENHHKWADAAKELGCHSIRVNAGSAGSYEDQMFRAADGLRALTEYAAKLDLNVIVENHGGLSSNAEWLVGVIEQVDHERCGTLPDFGNFRIKDDEWYDRYLGVQELMPYAKAVSAKSYDFDDRGDDTKTDFLKMMKIVLDADYHGWVGIEYEGGGLSEAEGIKATKTLLERVRDELA